MSGVEHNLISFGGDLTVATISQAHAELAAALGQDGPVVLDIEGVSEIDLTFVQLLESARRKAAETGRNLTLRQPAGGAVLETLRRGGFLDEQTSERTRFWLQGNAQ